MKVAILAIGDELALGQTVDTNSAWIAAHLAERGVMTCAQLTVSDVMEDIVDAFGYLCQRADMIICTGGLGPTDDDLTRQALADYLGDSLVFDENALEDIQAFFDTRKRKMADRNRVQAYRPSSAKCLHNPAGTAPGLKVKRMSPTGTGTQSIYCFAGVPHEMKTLYEKYVTPSLPSVGEHYILTHKLNTFGIGESNMAELLNEFLDRNREPLIGTTVSDGYVSLRIRAESDDENEARTNMHHTITALKERVGTLLISEEDKTLPQVVSELLTEQNKTVTTAESCTGGLICKTLTDITGSSAFFEYAQITYANDYKIKTLNVNQQTLIDHGAVSEKVAEEMAIGALQNCNADFALSVTGIAGPTGGTEEKPVGLVYIGLAIRDAAGHITTQVTRNHFPPGARKTVRQRACLTALNMLRLQLI